MNKGVISSPSWNLGDEVEFGRRFYLVQSKSALQCGHYIKKPWENWVSF